MSKQYGAAFHGAGYQLSGAFHQGDHDARLPWVLGFDYQAQLHQNVWG
jgi:hypothetical protein